MICTTGIVLYYSYINSATTIIIRMYVGTTATAVV